MLTHLRPALVLLVLMTVLTGVAYPMAITGLAKLLFPQQARGSLVIRDGKVVGSSLIGQSFTSDKYFHGRPSATTDTDPKDPSKTIPAPYNAANSNGSNLGPTSKALVESVNAAAEKLHMDGAKEVPVDLVTASASGLDPDISPAAAQFQISRIAKARNVPEAKVSALVDQFTEYRLLGFIGEPHVNVLALNLALDEMTAPNR